MKCEINEDVSELIGVIIGDGCISKYKPKDRAERTVLLITGNWETDRKYYEQTLMKSFKENFQYDANLYHRKDDNTARLWVYDKSVVSFFIQIGLKVGPKKDITIPKKIFQKKRNLISCIRGIFNTDGSVYSRYSKKYKRHAKKYTNYAVTEFKSKSKKLIKQIKNSLQKIGIKTTVISKPKGKSTSVVRITSQKNVKKFFTSINPRKYHWERYKKIINPSLPKASDN